MHLFLRVIPYCLLIALAGFFKMQAAESARPNIVLILADDLGYGDLGCYGQTKIKTPRLDQMAAEGIRFTRFYAGAPVCAPSRCVLMTGKNTGRCTVRGNAGRRDMTPQTLKAEDVTVAEILKQAGYATALIGKWGLGEAGSPGSPIRQGFDYFFGYLNQSHAHNYYPAYLVRNEERVPLRNEVPGEGPFGKGYAVKKLDYSPDLLIEEAIQWIHTNRQGPFFLYFAPTLPHANNEAGQKGMEVPDDAPYSKMDWPEGERNKAAMINRLDRDVGRILDELNRLGISKETVVFFSSDNGPHKEGGVNPDFFASAGGLRGKKRDLYEGGIRVPMIVRWPGKIKPGVQTDHVSYLGDLFQTASELLNVPGPNNLDSRSILPLLLGTGSNHPGHDYLYWEFHEAGFSQAVLVEGRWKGLRKASPDAVIEIYDLQADPREQKNIAPEQPAMVERVRKLFTFAREESELWPIRGKK